MTTTWVQSLTDVGPAGDITQLYPASCTVGTGLMTTGTERRKPTGGTLYHAQAYTDSLAGGIIELWDMTGLIEGAANNVDTADQITDAFVAAEIAAGRGRLIWSQAIVGAAGGSKSLVSIPIPFVRGMCARFHTAGGPTGDTCQLTISADGGFYKFPIAGF